MGVAEAVFAGVFYLFGKVGGVALVAGDAVAGMAEMSGVREELLPFTGDVAGEAASGVFRGRGAEGEHGMFFEGFGGIGVVTVGGLDGIGMSFAGAVAGFAALDEVLAGDRKLRVSGLEKLSGL